MNRLLPGRNYGWPLYSLDMDYDGTPVEYGKDLGITFELSDIEQSVVDLTPSPAVSSLIVTTGEQFPSGLCCIRKGGRAISLAVAKGCLCGGSRVGLLLQLLSTIVMRRRVARAPADAGRSRHLR